MAESADAVAIAMAAYAAHSYPKGMRPGDHDPDWECPWGMGEVDWVGLADAALAALRALPAVAENPNQAGTPILHSVGVDYCLAHHGIRNEDDECCAWREDAGNECETCDGTGAAEDDVAGGTFDCADCDGFGFTPCDLRELVWVEAKTMNVGELQDDLEFGVVEFAAMCRERCSSPAQGHNGELPCGGVFESDYGESFGFCGRHMAFVIGGD